MAIENIEQGTLPAHIKAVIALTSWKKRINTVGLTIFNLRCVCGRDFHIVLTLAEEEFPRKERELPEDLMRMNRVGIFEILWVKKNYKSFKKVLFAMDKYKTYPIISADDDCLYICNYANELYNKWLDNRTCVIRYNMYNKNPNWYYTQGPCTIYPPNSILWFDDGFHHLTITMTKYQGDDSYLTVALKNANVSILHIYRGHKFPFIFHDEINPLSGGNNLSNPDFKSCYAH